MVLSFGNKCFAVLISFLFLFLAGISDLKSQVREGRVFYQGEKELSLAGEWEFYFDTLFVTVPEGLSPSSPITVPGNWSSFGYPSKGKACYRLVITADDEYTRLAANVPETHGASELYLNGRKISSSGEVHADPQKTKHRWVPEVVPLMLRKGENELVWQVANYKHSKSGMNKAIRIGHFDGLFDERELQVISTIFLMGSVFALSLFFFGMHLYWKKDPPTLYLSLAFLSYGLRFGLYDLHLINKALADVPWIYLVRAEYLTTYLSFFFFILFFRSMFPEEIRRRLYLTLLTYFGVGMVVILLAPVYYFSTMHKLTIVVMLATLIILLWIVFLAYRRNKIKSHLALSFVGFFLFAPVPAILFYLNWIPYVPFVENLSTLGIMLTLAFMMAVRFVGLFNQVEGLQIQAENQREVIAKSLQEKEVLLGEIHHRVKNNLQTINSLLLLQSKSIKDEGAVTAIQESQYRIQTMALVHQKLYQTNDKGMGVNVQTYFKDLVKSIVHSLDTTRQVKVWQEVDDFVLDLDTIINIGLITNELIVNCLKYAFDDTIAEPEIRLKLSKSEDHLYLEIKDNGLGFDINNSDKDGNFGLKLVSSLSRKLKCKPETRSSSGGGTKTSFVIKQYTVIG
ncbi:sensor histidine kinase [Marinoscillum furvescens]|uniref:histidine kinase n=1 Tax=Marinoscillum furvescens DSM 4134 TaxID=1122208 RepID=A0A3D9L6U1_MARFU|nr:histidine kinase dimerization/phosphoacceptor domain -containing protein [Marinoscillum furvescens]REE01068.1 two-component sensor histidine kinase [Marinoscillum furvescens DSM 4134]